MFDFFFYIFDLLLFKLAFSFRSLGQEVFLSVMEADYEISSYALEHSCMGILGQDTDFIIYNRFFVVMLIKTYNNIRIRINTNVNNFLFLLEKTEAVGIIKESQLLMYLSNSKVFLMANL